MNDMLIRLGIAALLKSVKNYEKKIKLRRVCQELVHGILLAYADDPEFLEDEDLEPKHHEEAKPAPAPHKKPRVK